jgi:2-polyprenyl-6-methoxyphenol hydroxylase-like FAD-dependent oxidoreductase
MDIDVAIVGGGIGGLALAVALQKNGVSAVVFERASGDREVGAGLVLWSGTMATLKRLGVDLAFAKPASAIWEGQIASATGAILTRMNVRKAAERIGIPSHFVHRRELLAAIEARVAPGTLHFGARCHHVREDASHAVLAVEGREEVRARLVVGADGLRSVVRAAILGEAALRYGGETCYRGLARFRRAEPHVLREVQGRGLRCSVCTLDEELVYWWAAVAAPPGERVEPGARRALLLDRYRGFAFEFLAAVEATDSDAILQNDLFDRVPVRTWSRRGRMTLLGDAAHPTTPNLGLGACMAIEDAALLARLLAIHSHGEALRAYEQARVRPTSAIIERSRRFGKLGQWRSPLAVKTRELVARSVPAWVLEGMVEDLVRSSAPNL